MVLLRTDVDVILNALLRARGNISDAELALSHYNNSSEFYYVLVYHILHSCDHFCRHGHGSESLLNCLSDIEKVICSDFFEGTPEFADFVMSLPKECHLQIIEELPAIVERFQSHDYSKQIYN